MSHLVENFDVSAILKSASLQEKKKNISKKDKSASKKFLISGIDAVENGGYILNFTPPNPVRMIRISNISDNDTAFSLVGFPQQYFYTNGNYGELIISEHNSIELYIVLMCNLPKDKEYIFEIKDYEGQEARITIRINKGWEEYISKQIQEIRKKDAQGASVKDLYQTAKRIISKSGYKLPTKNSSLVKSANHECVRYNNNSGKSLQEILVFELLVAAGISDKRISSLNDEDDWKHFSTCRDGLRYYLELHPDGKWANEARLRINRTEVIAVTKVAAVTKKLTKEEQAQAIYEWQHDIRYAYSSHTVEEFLQRFPVGSHVPEAKKKLEELRAIGQ